MVIGHVESIKENFWKLDKQKSVTSKNISSILYLRLASLHRLLRHFTPIFVIEINFIFCSDKHASILSMTEIA